MNIKSRSEIKCLAYAQGVLCLGILALLICGISGCDVIDQILGKKKGKNNAITSAPYTTTHQVPVGAFDSPGFSELQVPIPAESLAIGIIVQGSRHTDRTFIEHMDTVLVGAQNNSIRNPDGRSAPLSFNRINGRDQPFIENQSVAVHFPNNGRGAILAGGTWSFPLGVATAGGRIVADRLQPYVYYKTETSVRPTLKLNVYVLEGVSNFVNTAAVEADPEIQGALRVLKNVYVNNPNLALNLDLSVTYATNAMLGNPLVAPGVVASRKEQFDLFASLSDPGQACGGGGPGGAPHHDAMNIFIVNRIDYLNASILGIAGGIPGPFNRHCTVVAGTMAEYQGDGIGNVLGFILAHEFGHYLGLFHTSQTGISPLGFSIIGYDPIGDTAECTTVQAAVSLDNCPDRDNLMFPIASDNPNAPVSVGQGNVVRYNPGVLVP